MLLERRQSFRDGACPDLRNNAIKVYKPKWDSNETADLPDPVALTFYEAQSGDSRLREFDANGRSAYVFNRSGAWGPYSFTCIRTSKSAMHRKVVEEVPQVFEVTYRKVASIWFIEFL